MLIDAQITLLRSIVMRPGGRQVRTRIGAGEPQADPATVTAMPLDHLSLQATDVSATAAFYDTALAPLGIKRIMDFGTTIGYGDDFPYFWIGEATTQQPQREIHIAFRAADRDTVDRWFQVAKAAGAEVLHEPRVWPEYHESYYGAFVRDPDGNNIEAVCHTPT